MASTNFNLKPTYAYSGHANTNHAWSSLYTNGSLINETRIGGVLIVNFVLVRESDLAAQSDYVDVFTLDNSTPNLDYIQVEFPLSGSSETKAIQFRVRGGKLQFYAPGGWKAAWTMRGQIVAVTT